VGMLKKQLKYKFRITAVIVFVIAIIAGSATVAMARDLPASTFLPFNNSQSVNFDAAASERYIYPTGSNYIFISYQHDIITGDRDIRAQMLDTDGKELWKKVYTLKGQDTLLMMHMQGSGFVMAVNSREMGKDTIRLLQVAINGEIDWQKDLPLRTVNSVANTNDNGLVIAGTTGEEDQDIRIIKMDKSGEWHSGDRSAAKWEKTYVNSGNQQASEIIQLLDKEGYNDGWLCSPAKGIQTAKTLHVKISFQITQQTIQYALPAVLRIGCTISHFHIAINAIHIGCCYTDYFVAGQGKFV
jgi:hypothetical protein